MSLHPLANLFAVSHADPVIIRELAAQMRSHGDFTEVWRPADSWVVGLAPLPCSEPDGAVVRDLGFAFVEGKDLVEGAAKGDSLPFFRQVAKWAWESPEKLVALPGDFGFVRFRPAGEATLVRSCGGLVPFYYGFLQGRVVMGTRLAYFVRYLPEEVPVDPLTNVIWSACHLAFPNNRSFLAGISILKSGRFARIERGKRIEIGRYWHPRSKVLPSFTPSRTQEHAERLRALLIGKLERDLDPGGGNLLTLSGGVDSSAIAAVACGIVGRKLSTWSMVPDQEDICQVELSYIQPLASRFAFERSWFFRLNHRSRLAGLRDGPNTVFQVLHPALCALPQLVREAPIRVLVGGEYADMVGGAHGRVPDWLAHNSLFRLLSVMGLQPLGPRVLLSWAKRFLTSLARTPTVPYQNCLPDFVRPELAEEYRAWFEMQRSEAGRDQDPLRFLQLSTEADEWVIQNWEAASAVGVRRSLPFYNREMIELAFDCHPAELIGPGTKKLLRLALADDVPARNLHRTDKGCWGGYLLSPVRLTWDADFTSLMSPVVMENWWPRPSKIVDYHQAIHLTALKKFEDLYRAWRLRRGETV